MKTREKIVVGLGNPGPEFENTYHNVGILALKKMAGSAEFKTYKHLFEYAEAQDTAFIAPLTFMNGAGAAVREALKKFGAKPKDLVVIHDDSDIPVGKYKISRERGSAGHKGVQSIMDALHTNDFTRIRIGIRAPNEVKRKKAEEFVLKKIRPADREVLEELFASL